MLQDQPRFIIPLLAVHPGHFLLRLTKVALLGVLAMAAQPGSAFTISTNCVDSGPSLPVPKRIRGGCPDLGFPLFSTTGHPNAAGGLLVSFNNETPGPDEESFGGIGRTDVNGSFQWRIAATNAYVWDNGWDSNRFALVQGRDFGAGPVACLGVYSDASGLPVPVFEYQLPISDHRRVQYLQLPDGTAIVALDKTNSVVLLAFSSPGQLLWAKELSSPEIPVAAPPYLPNFLWQNPISSNHFLVGFSGPTNEGSVSVSRSLVARISSDGVVQWGRKLEVPSYFAYGSSSGPTTPAGEFLITVGDYDFSTFSIVSTMVKIAGDGSLVWGRRFNGLGGGFGIPQPDGSILTQFYSGQHQIIAVLNAAGSVTAAVQFDAPTYLSVLSEPADKFYYYASHSTNASTGPYRGIIGSSSLMLDDFAWREYKLNGVGAPGAWLHMVGGTRLGYFIADPTRTNWIDMVFLDLDLVPEAECELFSPISFPAVTPALDVVSVSPLVTVFTFDMATL